MYVGFNLFTDIFVNGRLFEIEASTKEKRQSYFSDIAVINSQLTVIGSKLSKFLVEGWVI